MGADYNKFKKETLTTRNQSLDILRTLCVHDSVMMGVASMTIIPLLIKGMY